MPTAQQFNQFISQPINNLLVFQAIISLGIVVGVIILVWKFGPALYNLYKQQADTNAKMTKILEESEKRAEQRTTAITALGEKTDHQTNVLESQTEELKKMGKVFSDHQITTHDTVANLSDKVDSLETTVNTNTESITALTEQIKALVARLEDKAACADAEERMRKLRDEMLEIATREQARRATDNHPAVNVLPQATESHDTGAAGSGQAAA